MHQLVYEPDQAMQNMLNRFIEEYVFFEEEDGMLAFICQIYFLQDLTLIIRYM